MSYVPPAAATSVARTGSTGSWTNLANIVVSDGVYATSNTLTAGVKTPLIHATGFSASPAVATPSLMTLRVERLQSPANEGTLAVSDVVQLTLAGSPIGINLSQGEGLPDLDTVISYTVDLNALGVTAAQINAGAVGVDLGWASSLSANAINPANWSFNTYPGSPSSGIIPIGYPGPWGTSARFHMVATYIGPAPVPTYAPISIQSVVNLSGPFNVPGNYSLNNGQGATGMGTIPLPPGAIVSVSNTKEYVLPVVAGIATLDLTMTRSNTGASGGAQDYGIGNVYASIVVPDPAVVLVDSVFMMFTDGGANGGGPDPGIKAMLDAPFRYIPKTIGRTL